MTESARHLHSPPMVTVAPVHEDEAAAVADLPSFESLYDRYFAYIWRSVQCLGVPASQTDDVVQEVFVVAHRKLGAFEGRSSLRTWLYGIALRCARVHRRKRKRHERDEALDAEGIAHDESGRPDQRAESAEAVRILRVILERLDDDQREVFVLAELEELSAPEIAEILGVKLNTVYSRLRLAREAFAKAAARHRAQDGWRDR